MFIKRIEWKSYDVNVEKVKITNYGLWQNLYKSIRHKRLHSGGFTSHDSQEITFTRIRQENTKALMASEKTHEINPVEYFIVH